MYMIDIEQAKTFKKNQITCRKWVDTPTESIPYTVIATCREATRTKTIFNNR